MSKSFIRPLVGSFVLCSLLSSCDSNSTKQFSTKQDSLAFAQAVMERYPGMEAGTAPEQLAQDTVPAPAGGRSFENVGMEPITAATIKNYSANYDKTHPLKDPKGFYYQGFSIDPAGYAQLLKNPSIQGLYLRLGQRDDGSYTIMVLGTDKGGKIINPPGTLAAKDTLTDFTNFDALPPCPENCPN